MDKFAYIHRELEEPVDIALTKVSIPCQSLKINHLELNTSSHFG